VFSVVWSLCIMILILP